MEYKGANKPRLCKMRKWADFPGYGLDVKCEGKTGHFIGKVEEGSPAQAAGMKEGDRIVEVNNVNIGNENHSQVVNRIKAGGDQVSMLLVDHATDQHFKDQKVVISSDMSEVVRLENPPRPSVDQVELIPAVADRKKKRLVDTRKSSSTKSDLSATLLAGSEEIFFCHPCSTDNLHIEAVGYCHKCQEYMCDTCYKYHRKNTATKHHILLDKAGMPIKFTNDLNETCPKHQDKLLEYFCNSHSELCCIVCLNNDHRLCKVISHIPDVSDGIASSKEYKNLRTDLIALVTKITIQQGNIKLYTKDNDKYQSESLAGIRELREEVNELLDKYEETAVMEVSKIHHENYEMIKAMTLKSQGVVSDLTAMIANLDTRAKSGKNNQLFVNIKMTRHRLSTMEDDASDVTDCRITRYGFHHDVKIKEIMASLSSIWSLSIRQYCDKTKARYGGEVNVKADVDTDDCNIGGVVVLSGGDIVVTDHDNKALKLVNMESNRVTSRLALSSVPQDITSTKPNQVAVSLEHEGKIEIYTVTDVLSRSNTIRVDEKEFSGMCYAGDKFILTYYHKGLVKIVDMSGRVLSTIVTDENGDRLFTNPRYIAVGRNNDVAYVTDLTAYTVTTMTLSGHVISVYRDTKLKKPRGITVGPGNNVFVCSEDTSTVLQLSATGEFQQVLLDKQRIIPSFPRAIAYDDVRDRIYISSASSTHGACNCVKFFQIE